LASSSVVSATLDLGTWLHEALGTLSSLALDSTDVIDEFSIFSSLGLDFDETIDSFLALSSPAGDSAEVIDEVLGAHSSTAALDPAGWASEALGVTRPQSGLVGSKIEDFRPSPAP